ncbi:hypothetical protein KEM09_02580 [Carboxylicivirga mesophila]|uniref:Phage integrase SAM-like domain-containing protein n=1 Tax=Carboxylicivirga mesophila TaxID=1166478 RepID=A0ABS5K5M0_9BACT|nr:hypothetical protein [Carboxylicivirga mesophila]MBS2210265.1 hypothetical protein [Carboxylicivirga mesophila]
MERQSIDTIVINIINGKKENLVTSKMFFDVLHWSFIHERKFLNEELRETGIEREIESLEAILKAEKEDEAIDFYYNQLNRYLSYHFFEDGNFQHRIIGHFKKIKIDKATKKRMRQLAEKTRKKYGQATTPEQFTEIICREMVKDSKDLNKKSGLNLRARFDRMLYGYQLKSDENSVNFYIALKEFKSFLEGELYKPEVIIPERIKVYQSKEEIVKYFNRLTIINKEEGEFEGEQILSKEDVDKVLSFAFEGFEQLTNYEKVFVKCTNESLKRFIREFYDIEKTKCLDVKAYDYYSLLKDAFLNFENWSLSTVKGKFSNPRPMKYPFR